MGNSTSTLDKVSEISDDSIVMEDWVSELVLFASTIEKTKQVVKAVYNNSVGSLKDANKAFTVGLVDGLLSINNDSNTKFHRGVLDKAKLEFSNFKQTFNNLENDSRQKLNRTITDDVLGEIRRMPEEHLLLGESNIAGLNTNYLKAAEKIALQRAKTHESTLIAEASVKIKAYAITISGLINQYSFNAGKKAGGLIRENIVKATKNLGLDEKIDDKTQEYINTTLRKSLAVYIFSLEKAVDTFSEIVDLSYASVTTLIAGMISATQERSISLSSKRNLSKNIMSNIEYALNNPYKSLVSTTNLASTVIQCICGDLILSFKEQEKKGNAFNSKLAQNDGVQQVLQENPWKKAKDLALQKELIDGTIGKELMGPCANIIKSSILAAKATMLTTSFRLGYELSRAFLENNQSQEIFR